MNKRLQQFRKIFTPADKRKFLGITFLMAIAGVMEMAGIGLLAGVVVLFLNPENANAICLFDSFKKLFPESNYNLFIIAAIGSVALLLVLKNLFTFFIVSLQSRFICDRQNAICCRLFGNFLHSDYQHFIANSTDEYNGVIERVKRVFTGFFNPALQLVADIIIIAFLSAAALLMLPWSAITVLLLTVVLAWLTTKCFQRRNQRVGEELLQVEQAENKLRFNALLGIEQIKISGAEENFFHRFSNSNFTLCRRFATLFTLGQIPRLALECIALLLVCAVFAILLFSGIAREEIVLIFTVLVAAMARMLPALSRAHYNLTQLRQYGVLLDELSDKLTALPQENITATAPDTDFVQDIVVENLSFAYTPDSPVLQNFNCQIPAMKITGISGRSGTGKTTLINLLATLFHPQAGRIKCGGTDISRNIPAWRKQLGFVPQNVFIFDGSLRENVALGCEKEKIDDAKVASALRDAQLANFADTPEMMLNSHSGLSGGQRQRIGIARALYNDPAVLILDEATSALDAATETGFLKVLENLRGKVTIIVISHRKETLDICDKIISL